MIEITPEMRQALQNAGKEPVRVVDPLTNAVYVLVLDESTQTISETKELYQLLDEDASGDPSGSPPSGT